MAGNLTAGMRGPFEATRDAAESPTEIAKALQSEPVPTAQVSTPPPAPAPAPASAGVQAAYAAASKNAVAVTEPTATTSRITVIICRYGPGSLTCLPVPDRAAASGKVTVSSSTDGDWIARLTQRLKEHAQGRKCGTSSLQTSATTALARLSMAMCRTATRLSRSRRFGSWPLNYRRSPGSASTRSTLDPPPSPAMIASAKVEEKRVAVAALRAAPPAQLASKDLVRKSKAYWNAYATDMIRQIFDGGFGRDMNENLSFQKLFCTYVELFSKNCRDSLPAHRESVTITTSKVQKDQNGSVTGQEILDSWTVEVGSRFAPYYRRYAESLLSPGQTQAGAIGIKMSGLSPGAAVNELFAPGRAMVKFFATEKCQSAAMRQLGENLLRGATGERSLQQSGEKIAGAAAETDKDLPPGRYARFVDGCNGFYRDPANARLAGLHSSAWCQCLGEKDQHQMSAATRSTITLTITRSASWTRSPNLSSVPTQTGRGFLRHVRAAANKTN